MATTIFLIRPETYPVPPSFTNTKSLLFDGVDERVEVGSISELLNVASFTISGWVKYNSFTTGQNRWLGFFDSFTNCITFSVSNVGKVYFLICNGSTAYGYINVTNTITLNNWFHYSAVYDGSGVTNADKLKIYINGSNQTLTFSGTIPATSPTISASNMMLGSRDTSTQENTDGYIDEVSIFDYALTSGQVSTIYNSGQPNNLNDLATPPVHWWRCGDGDTFPTINDVGTTGGNNGTMTNMESGDIVTDVP